MTLDEVLQLPDVTGEGPVWTLPSGREMRLPPFPPMIEAPTYPSDTIFTDREGVRWTVGRLCDGSLARSRLGR